MGCFNRAAIVDGPGTVIGDGQRIPTVEELHQVWDEVISMEGASEYNDAMAALGPMLDAFKPKPAAKSGGNDDKLTVAKIFEQMPSAFQADAAKGVDVIFQYDINNTADRP